MTCFLNSLLMLCLMVGLSSAIRGERRRLQDPPQPKDDKAVKCRPLPKGVKDAADLAKSGSPTPSPKSLPPATLKADPKTDAPTLELPYCTDPPDPKGKGAKADCPALGKGELPKRYSGSVDGYLKVDVSYNQAPNETLVEISVVLQQETSAAIAGCPTAKGPKASPTGVQNVTFVNVTLVNVTISANGTAPTILGVNFTNVQLAGECASSNKTLNCSEVTSNVTILYDGEANATEQARMFDLLKSTIESQAATGSFDGVGEVSNVQTGSETSRSSGEGKSKSAKSTIIAVGAIAGVAAVLGALFAGYQYRKRNSADRSSFEGEPVWTGVVEVVEEESVEASLKKPTGNAFG